jgi:hypothetical protein
MEMLRSLVLIATISLCHSFVWNNNNNIQAFVAVVRRSYKTASTQLNPHRFNGGYDPGSPLTWTPQQAAEFTIFHEGSPQHAGMQLKTAIKHWSGENLAEFLTRLYLGHQISSNSNDIDHENKNKLVYEPQNVRSPQWKGLDTREGIFALKDLLKEALSKDSLSAQEVSRFAERFFLKEYKWPSQKQPFTTTSNKSQSAAAAAAAAAEVVFENDSFYSLGHARTLARIILSVRKEQSLDDFNWYDFVLMITLPEKNDNNRETAPMKLIEFFQTIAASVAFTTKDKADIVNRMAMSGWQPGSIPKFMAELFPEETMNDNHSVCEMRMVVGDSFLDFPSSALVVGVEEDKEQEKQVVAATTGDTYDEGQSLKSAKEIVKSEYEELVQSYWKKVEVPRTKKNSKTKLISNSVSS